MTIWIIEVKRINQWWPLQGFGPYLLEREAQLVAKGLGEKYRAMCYRLIKQEYL